MPRNYEQAHSFMIGQTGLYRGQLVPLIFAKVSFSCYVGVVEGEGVYCDRRSRICLFARSTCSTAPQGFLLRLDSDNT